jgi:hypothetical protein
VIVAAVTIALENPESSMILPKTAPSNNADHLTLVQHYEEIIQASIYALLT